MLRLGAWEVDPSSNELRRGTEVAHIEPKAMDLLVAMAARPGIVLGRDELIAAVWPGVVVGDEVLTQAVIKLRRALGDTAREPAYIETIAKRGYRLIAPVVAERAPEPPSDDLPTAIVLSVAPRRRPLIVLASLALVASVGLLMFWWQVDRDISPAGVESDAQSAHGAQPTVVIDSFQPLGDDDTLRLLTHGLTSDLTTDLSKLHGLWVISGDAAASKTDAPTEANNPGRYRISGDVQQTGTRLRVHVFLTDVATARQLWAERYDREAQDLFSMQDELVQGILEKLPLKVSRAERQRVARRYTRNFDAYQSFQRGQAALLVRGHTENETARAAYQRALELDPGFARAYAGLALTFAADYRNQWTRDGDKALARAFELAETALQIDAEVAENRWVLAYVHAQRREHRQALAHLDAAVQANPSFADAYALMGGVQTYVGQPEKSVPLLRKAMRLNPDAGSLYLLLLGRAYFFLGDLELAKLNLTHALNRNPLNVEAHVYMAAALLRAGDPDGASWEVDLVRSIEPDFQVRDWLLSYPMTDTAQIEQLARALQELGA